MVRDWSVRLGGTTSSSGGRASIPVRAHDRAIVYRHLVPLIRVSTLAGMALIGFLALIVVNAIPEPVDE